MTLIDGKGQEEILNKIDANSQDLMKEFYSHYEEVHSKVNPDADIRSVFEAWAIQKISGLQITACELAEEILTIKAELETLKSK